MMKRLSIISLFFTAALASVNIYAQELIYPESFVPDSTGLRYGHSHAIASVDGDNLPLITSMRPSNAIGGLLPGVTGICASGFNQSSSLVLRGRTSRLILVDGVERSLDQLSIEEIDKIIVLKDAAAQALYGMKASGGLILVTTKRGTPGKKINVSFKSGIGTPTALPDWADASTYATAVNFARRSEGLAPAYTKDEIAAYASGAVPEFYPNVDWISETLRKWSTTTQAGISASGGDNRIRYYTLLKYTNIQGLVKEYDAQPEYSTQLTHSALNVRTNLDINISRTTSAHVNLFGKIYENNSPGAVTANSIMTLLYALPANVYPIKYSDGVWGGRSGYSRNPVAQTSDTGYSTSHVRALYTDLALDQKLDFITPGLKAFARGSVDILAQNNDVRSKSFQYETKFGELNVVPGTGEMYVNETNTTKYGEEDYDLGFSSSLASMTRGTAVFAGFNYQKAFGRQLLNAAVFYKMNNTIGLGKGTTYINQGVYSYADYSWNDKLSASFALSYVGTNRLPKGSRWGLFPALSLGWKVSDGLNLRASAGLNGSDSVTQNLEKYQFGSGSSFVFSNDMVSYSGMREIRLPSAYYSYSKAAKFDIGADITLWDALSLTVDGFFDRYYDLLVSGANETSSMIGITLTNVSEGVNVYYGFDAGLYYRKKAGDWEFDIGGNFNMVKSRVVDQNEVYRKYDYLKRTGRSTGQLWGYEVIGFFNSEEEIQNSPRQTFSELYPGDYKYKDQNGDGIIDEYDEVPLGGNSSFPEFYYGLDINLSYKNIGFRANIQGLWNYSVNLSTTGMHRPLINGANLSVYYWDNCWKPGVESAIYPRPTITGSSNNYRANSVFIADRSFVKLRNVELWYNLPGKWLKKVKIDNARLFISGQNLFTLTNIKVLDPEVLDAAYPLLMTFQTGLSLSF